MGYIAGGRWKSVGVKPAGSRAGLPGPDSLLCLSQCGPGGDDFSVLQFLHLSDGIYNNSYFIGYGKDWVNSCKVLKSMPDV